MSRLAIFPPVATIYPNDVQEFTAQSVPPPPMWDSITNSGIVGGDFILFTDAGQPSVTATGAHQLFSGSGIVEYILDDQSRPNTGGAFVMNGFIKDVVGFQYFYNVVVNPTNIVIKDELNNTLATISETVAAGDILRLELTAGFRFYRNGALKHSRTGLGTQVTYPMIYQLAVFKPVISGTAQIKPPHLIGDWRLAPVVDWTAPSHGVISNAGPSLKTRYSGGTVPGSYVLTGRIEAAADTSFAQRALATIVIPPLQILGPTEVTLPPGQKSRFKTNYDKAQTDLIQWSVVGFGGNFTEEEYTAPTGPGAYVVRATATVNSQIADIKITVPTRITNLNNYTAAKGSEQIDFDTNIPVIPVFVGGGLIAEGTGNIVPGLPPGIQQNDIMLLFVQTSNQTVSAPAGWAAVTNSPQGTGTGGAAGSTRLDVFWRRATVSESPVTVTDPGDHAIGQILAFRNCIDTGNPWDVTAGDVAAGASTSVSIPGATTTVANCLIVAAVSHGVDTASSITSGYTNGNLTNIFELTDVSTTQGTGGGFGVAQGEKAAAGAYGTTTATLANSSAQGRISIALKPALITWSASIGSINSSSGIWTAPSLAGQTARITVSNGTSDTMIEVQVLESFPLTDPSLPVIWERNLIALLSMSEDRSRRAARRKSPPFDSYEVKYLSRSLTESNTVDAFFDAHEFGRLFILDDKVRNVRRVGWFDSPIRHEGNDECAIDLSFRFLEARL